MRKRTERMRKVTVSCSAEYDIIIGDGVLSTVGREMEERFGGKRVCVISDDIVAPIYLKKVLASLDAHGVKNDHFVFIHGEGNKTMSTVESMLSFLAENRYTRSDMLIALGGGIVGDVTGFVAAIYQRGIEFIQIPTTVLSAVDSSVGGKTGVNLGGLKNQVGAFWQPSLVLCDPETFKTLPAVEYASGMAEVIKYAAICRPELAEAIRAGADIEEIIAECVSIKRDIVEQDERDTGLRQLLNLGHTFGHAVEKATSHAYTHGQAVAIGTVMAFRAAESMGICVKGEVEKIISLCGKFGLPTDCGCDGSVLLDAMQSDKKRLGGKITLVLPRKLGDTVLYKTDMSALPEILEAALER